MPCHRNLKTGRMTIFLISATFYCHKWPLKILPMQWTPFASTWPFPLSRSNESFRPPSASVYRLNSTPNNSLLCMEVSWPHAMALSADHLEYATEEDAKAMAESGTVAVLLPGAFYLLRETQRPPVELFRKHGVPMA